MLGTVMYKSLTNVTKILEFIILLNFDSFLSALPFINYISVGWVAKCGLESVENNSSDK